jgi:hypothetical protein
MDLCRTKDAGTSRATAAAGCCPVEGKSGGFERTLARA